MPAAGGAVPAPGGGLAFDPMGSYDLPNAGDLASAEILACQLQLTEAREREAAHKRELKEWIEANLAEWSAVLNERWKAPEE